MVPLHCIYPSLIPVPPNDEIPQDTSDWSVTKGPSLQARSLATACIYSAAALLWNLLNMLFNQFFADGRYTKGSNTRLNAS